MTPETRLFADPKRRLIVSGCLLSLVLFYMAACTCQYLAGFFAARPTLANLRRATFLQPRDAEYQSRLGRFFSLSASLPEALPYYQEATVLNPNRSRYWLDLAAAYAALGHPSDQAAAIDRAVAVDPTTPDVAWEAANLYVMQGENKKALREFRIVLTNDAPRSAEILPLCLRLQPDVDAILRDVLPPNSEVYFNFIDLLTVQGQDFAAAKVWAKLVSLKQPLERAKVFEYIRVLLARQHVAQALLVWRQAAPLCDLEAYQPSPSNLVVNGQFSLEVLNAGFDWRYQQLPGVSLALDPSEPHFGTHSLLLTFDGANVREAGIEQFVAVQPKTDYNFQAYFKAKDMQGAGGVALAVADASDGHTYFVTAPMRDVDFWKQASGHFATGPEARLLRIYVERSPADSPIRGKLWLDAISLTETSTPEEPPQREQKR